MQSLVQDLVQSALSSQTSLAQLLRHALVTAQRLDQPHIAEWISREMNGYTNIRGVPSYRHLLNSNTAENASSITLLQPAPLLEEQSHSANPVPISTSDGQQLHLLPRQLQSITEALRNVLLQWGLTLEKNNIVGKNGFFTEDEKKIAHQISQNFFHNSSSSSDTLEEPELPVVQTHHYDHPALKKLIEALEKDLQNPELDPHFKSELQAALTALKAQSSLSHPKWPVIHAIHTTLKDVVESGTQLVPYLAELFPL